MDVIEARTDQALDLDIQRQWRLIKSDNGTAVFRRATIQEVGEDNTVDIGIMRGDNMIDALANKTFHVWSEQDIDYIDWNDGLFR